MERRKIRVPDGWYPVRTSRVKTLREDRVVVFTPDIDLERKLNEPKRDGQ